MLGLKWHFSRYQKSYKEFLAQYPEYKETKIIDRYRKKEYSILDRQKHVYLDYTGGNLYAKSQLEKHVGLLQTHVYGNPHSSNPTSLPMTELVEKTRRHVLEFFHADPKEYCVIFTPNCSGALKLVGESYPFAGGQCLVTSDNHNSVLGIREFCKSKGGKVTYIPITVSSHMVDEADAENYLHKAIPGTNNLFAFPGQSNFSGMKYPLEWIQKAQELGWDVLLDAAALVPTSHLDLSKWLPDFVTVSFYKIFGYPTGVGALIARRKKLKKLHRPWFGGGTIVAVSLQVDDYRLAPDEAGFEDGTPNYLNLPAVDIGLSHIESIGIKNISLRVRTLTCWLMKNLLDLHHSNGRPVVEIYGPLTTEGHKRGGTLALNFFNEKGEVYNYRDVESMANKRKISLRTGCFCNPGSGELVFRISPSEIKTCFGKSSHYHSSEGYRNCLEQTHVAGAVRVSIGLMSNFHDVYRFMQFAKTFLN